MSFGFTSEVPVIRDAIDRATMGSHPTLVLAAASNEGGNDGVSWPARHDRVICVHATDSFGNKYQQNPSPSDPRNVFATLGQDVEVVVAPTRKETKSGTSVATPVAAGIAALTIACVRVRKKAYMAPSIRFGQSEKTRAALTTAFNERVRRLGTCDGMSAVFRLMAGSDTTRDGYRYIRPWTILHGDYLHHSSLVDRVFEAAA